MKGMTEKEILHRFGTMYGTLCGGDQGWSPTEYGEPETIPSNAFNVTVEDYESEEESPIVKDKRKLQNHSDDQFHQTLTDTLQACEAFPDIRGICMTKLKNVQHSILTMVSRRPTQSEGEEKLPSPFADVPNNDKTQKRHPSFLEKMYRGRKKPLAKRKVKDAQPPPPPDPTLNGHAFRKVIEVKEKHQDFLERVARDALDLNAVLDEDGNPLTQVKVPRKRTKKVQVLADISIASQSKDNIVSGTQNSSRRRQPTKKKQAAALPTHGDENNYLVPQTIASNTQDNISQTPTSKGYIGDNPNCIPITQTPSSAVYMQGLQGWYPQAHTQSSAPYSPATLGVYTSQYMRLASRGPAWLSPICNFMGNSAAIPNTEEYTISLLD